MTHTFDPAMRPTDALPVDFAERCAYMRLYGAQVRNLPPPPNESFGEEMHVLEARGHAVMTPSGYVLTAAGVMHWQTQVLQWESPTEVRSLYKGAVPAPRRILLALANYTDWVGLDEISRGRGRTHTLNVCRKMDEHGLVIATRDNDARQWQIRITDAGRIEAKKIAQETP